MNQNRIHYGSLEISERQRLLQQSDTISQVSQLSTQASIRQQAIQSETNNNTAPIESLQLTQYDDQQQESQKEQEKKFELQRQLRGIRVPTTEVEVKSQLRQLGQPVTYFGETAAFRRERLKKTIADFLIAYGKLPQFDIRQTNTSQTLENNYFLYEGIQDLKKYRTDLAIYSIKKAALRVEQQRLRRLLLDALDEDREASNDLNQSKSFEIVMAQFADSAGISRGVISPNQEYLATAGASGEWKLWNLHDCSMKCNFVGHLTKCHSVQFHPESTLTMNETCISNVASAAADQTIRLWSLDGQSSVVQKGHEDRVNKVIFHQMGGMLLSVSFDKTWRLWDLSRFGSQSAEILCQTGHSRGIYTGSIHPDGSLFFTGDMGGVGMIWDLRIGKSILPLTGHVKGILASDFSWNGYQLATGGDDNMLRIWDLRRRGQIEKIPAHVKLVSHVAFTPGRYLVSSSYDGTVKTWNSRDWSLGKVYKEHESKITSVCITNDCQNMITTAIDRKFVVWKKKQEQQILDEQQQQ